MNNWNEIVDILSSNITLDISEGIYQREIVNCLRMLGWRSKEGTLKEQVTLHIGNNNSIRPDIVLYKDNQPVLPIEIKRPTNISSSKEEKQLMSYMRQLKLNVGLYIGNNIQLYYDNPSDLDLPVCVLKAEFKENDNNGIYLCKMLTYDTFNLNEIEENCKKLYENTINKNCLQNKLNDFLSIENIDKNIKTLIKNKFMAEGFDEEILENELNNLEEQKTLEHNFIDSLLYATKNSEWLNKSILEDEADAIIEKVESDYVQLEEYKQALQEIKKIAEDDCKTCTVKLLGEDEINCRRCYKTKILQKCEVIDAR